MMNATVWVTFETIDKIEYFVVHDMLTGEKKKMKALNHQLLAPKGN